MLIAKSEEHSRARFKLANIASDALKRVFQACFYRLKPSLNGLAREIDLFLILIGIVWELKFDLPPKQLSTSVLCSRFLGIRRDSSGL